MNKTIITLLAIGAMCAPLKVAHAANSLDDGVTDSADDMLDAVITMAQEKAGIVLCATYSAPETVTRARAATERYEGFLAKPGKSDRALIYYAVVRMYIDDAAVRGVDVVCGDNIKLTGK